MLFAILGIWITTILSIGFGYLLGRYMQAGSDIKEDVKSVKKTVKRILHREPSGPVNRPTAEQVNRWANPEEAAEEEEMRKGLKQLLENDI